VKDHTLDCFHAFLAGMGASPGWTIAEREAVATAVASVGEVLHAHDRAAVRSPAMLCLNCNTRPRLSEEANFCRECSALQGEKVFEVEATEWRERLTALTGVTGTDEEIVSAVERLVGWSAADPKCTCAPVNGLHPPPCPKGDALERQAEAEALAVGREVVRGRRPLRELVEAFRRLVPAQEHGGAFASTSSKYEPGAICQHPSGLGVCGKNEPCEDHDFLKRARGIGP
jgi:hypothetical protein